MHTKSIVLQILSYITFIDSLLFVSPTSFNPKWLLKHSPLTTPYPLPLSLRPLSPALATMVPIKRVEHELLGFCLTATEDITSGTVICKEDAELSSKMLLSTIQYKKGLHVNLPVDGYIWRTEHKCKQTANAYLLVQREGEGEAEGDLASVSLIATKDIKEGEHVGYDYNTSEVILSRSFQCGCGCPTDVCHGTVGGFFYLTSDKRDDLVSLLGSHTLSPAVKQVWMLPN